MANSQLRGTTYDIPSEVLHMLNMAKKRFSNIPVNSSGMRRCNYLLKSKKLSYENLKRLKNYFDHADEEEMYSPRYFLNGGPAMKKWIKTTLDEIRGDVRLRKQVRSDAEIQNAKRDDAEIKPTSISGNPTSWRNSEVGTDRSTIVQESLNKMKKLINY